MRIKCYSTKILLNVFYQIVICFFFFFTINHNCCHFIFYIIQNELPRLKHYVHRYIYLLGYFCRVTKISALCMFHEKNCIQRGHYFIFCESVDIVLTTASVHSFASNLFYLACTKVKDAIYDIDKGQRKV